MRAMADPPFLLVASGGCGRAPEGTSPQTPLQASSKMRRDSAENGARRAVEADHRVAVEGAIEVVAAGPVPLVGEIGSFQGNAVMAARRGPYDVGVNHRIAALVDHRGRVVELGEAAI